VSETFEMLALEILPVMTGHSKFIDINPVLWTIHNAIFVSVLLTTVVQLLMLPRDKTLVELCSLCCQ